jgi:hypothetical protein
MKLDPKTGTALAVVLAAMRPDWPGESVVTFLRTHADALPFKSLSGFIVAAVTTANDPGALTPGAILHAREAATPSTAQAPATGARCVDHPMYPAATCLYCTSEIKGGDRPKDMRGLHWEVQPAQHEPLPHIPTPSGPTWMDRAMGKDE